MAWYVARKSRRRLFKLCAVLLALDFFCSVEAWVLNPMKAAKSLANRLELERIAKSEGLAVEIIGALNQPSSHQDLWAGIINSADRPDGTIFGFPDSEGREVSRVLDIFESAGAIHLNDREMSIAKVKTKETTALLVDWKSAPHKNSFASSDTPATIVRTRMKHWVERTLVGLKMCPFTGSTDASGHNLRDFGIEPTPIQYAESLATSLPELMLDFWTEAETFLKASESGASSIILAAPAWDSEEGWEAWHRAVFPALEASVLAARQGRTLGVVCFHPRYATPDEAFLRRHRFGHMHPPRKLGEWLERREPALSAALAAAGEGGPGGREDALQWAGSYQRRSPHAMINVLWARQLEAAENVRSSESLYARNLKRLLREGRPATARRRRGGAAPSWSGGGPAAPARNGWALSPRRVWSWLFFTLL